MVKRKSAALGKKAKVKPIKKRPKNGFVDPGTDKETEKERLLYNPPKPRPKRTTEPRPYALPPDRTPLIDDPVRGRRLRVRREIHKLLSEPVQYAKTKKA